MSEEKKDKTVRDLEPKKDAKGGHGGHNRQPHDLKHKQQ